MDRRMRLATTAFLAFVALVLTVHAGTMLFYSPVYKYKATVYVTVEHSKDNSIFVSTELEGNSSTGYYVRFTPQKSYSKAITVTWFLLKNGVLAPGSSNVTTTLGSLTVGVSVYATPNGTYNEGNKNWQPEFTGDGDYSVGVKINA